jgi:hypothetical protein
VQSRITGRAVFEFFLDRVLEDRTTLAFARAWEVALRGFVAPPGY